MFHKIRFQHISGPVLARLQSRFRIRSTDSGPAGFLPVIVPVTNVDLVAARTKPQQSNTTVTGTGAYNLMTVPDDEIWEVQGGGILRTTGTFTFDEIRVIMDRGDSTLQVAFIASSTTWGWALGRFWMYPGDAVGVNVDAHTANGNLACRLVVLTTAYGIKA